MREYLLPDGQEFHEVALEQQRLIRGLASNLEKLKVANDKLQKELENNFEKQKEILKNLN